MATYNFTVRATDDQGAFANRDFSITVNNTSVDHFVAVGDTHIRTSPDGINWTLRPDVNGRSCAYGNGKWIIIRSGSQAFESDDAVNWTAFSPGIPENISTATSLFYFNNQFYLVGGTTNAYYTWTSPTGLAGTWTRRSIINTSTNQLSSSGAYSSTQLAWNGSTTSPIIVVGIGYESGTYPGGIYTTTDLNCNGTWTRYTNLGNWHPHGIVYANGMFVGRGNGEVYTSVDGINWQSWPSNITTANYTRNATYGNGRFFLPSDVIGQGLQSTDGVTWSRVSGQPEIADTFAHTQFHDGMWVMVDATSTHYSYDAINWTSNTGLDTIGSCYALGIRP